MIPKNVWGVGVARQPLISAVCLFFGGLLFMPAVFADTITDTLDNWNNVAGHSQGLVLDSSNPDYFYNDNSRVKIGDGTSGAVGSFFYHVDGISSFAAFVYYWTTQGSIEVYASSDNVNWTPVTFTHSDPSPTTASGYAGWLSERIQADVPPGTSYLGFTLHGGSGTYIWTPQIGQVAIETMAVALPGPAGLSVVAGNGKASLAWFPVKNAKSYTIKRRTAASKDFHVISEGVKTTTFTDDGLTNSTKYYYAVLAETDKGTSGESDEVLAVPAPDVVVMADKLTDWNTASAHSPNLEFDQLLGTADCVHRTGNTMETIDYNLPGASGFALNVYSADGDMNSSLTVETSPDGTNWSILPTSLKLSAKPASDLYAAVCAPTGKLPSGTNYLRFEIGSDGSPAANPSLGQIRIMYAQTEAVKTAAAHAGSHVAP